PHISEAVDQADLVVASILSGNRNFEARVHPQVKMNFLASPMLVVVYALIGRIDVDIFHDPIDIDPNGEPVYLKDIWPSHEEINNTIRNALKQEDFKHVYDVIFDGNRQWRELTAPTGNDYQWNLASTYIQEAPFFKDISHEPAPVQDITHARVLLYLGDSVTTDHISPAGSFKAESAAGQYLKEKGIQVKD